MVSSPLSSCFAIGSLFILIEEAINIAQEAAECHIEGILIDSEPIPTPNDVENHQDNPDLKDGIWALVKVDRSKLSLKSKRINITMPERLIRTVDNTPSGMVQLNLNSCLKPLLNIWPRIYRFSANMSVQVAAVVAPPRRFVA